LRPVKDLLKSMIALNNHPSPVGRLALTLGFCHRCQPLSGLLTGRVRKWT